MGLSSEKVLSLVFKVLEELWRDTDELFCTVIITLPDFCVFCVSWIFFGNWTLSTNKPSKQITPPSFCWAISAALDNNEPANIADPSSSWILSLLSRIFSSSFNVAVSLSAYIQKYLFKN